MSDNLAKLNIGTNVKTTQRYYIEQGLIFHQLTDTLLNPQMSDTKWASHTRVKGSSKLTVSCESEQFGVHNHAKTL